MRRSAFITVALAALLAACATPTSITGSWKRPGFQGLRPQKVAVLSLSQDKVHQAVIGASMVASLKARGIAASRGVDILPDVDFSGKQPDPAQRSHFEALLSEKGYDLVITAVLLDVKRDKQYVPGHVEAMPYDYYDSLGTYWYTAGAVYDPGYWVTTSEVVMETNVYALPSGKLEWTGQSQTLDPANLQDFSDSYAPKLVGRLFHEGVLK